MCRKGCLRSVAANAVSKLEIISSGVPGVSFYEYEEEISRKGSDALFSRQFICEENRGPFFPRYLREGSCNFFSGGRHELMYAPYKKKKVCYLICLILQRSSGFH